MHPAADLFRVSLPCRKFATRAVVLASEAQHSIGMDLPAAGKGLLDLAARRDALRRSLPAKSQSLLEELHAIMSGAGDDPDSDCMRVKDILESEESGVTCDARMAYGETLLNCALGYDCGKPPQMLSVVLAAGANPNGENDVDSCRPLDSEYLEEDEFGEAKRELLVQAGGESANGPQEEPNDMTALNLSCRDDVDDEMMREIGDEIQELKQLDLQYCPRVSDAGLRALAGCPDLRTLTLRDNGRVTDAAVVFLAQRLPALKNLTLDACPGVGDASLKALAAHATSLTALDVTRNGCNEDDFFSEDELRSSNNQHADTPTTKVTDAGILALACRSNNNLMRLTLDQACRLTDASMVPFARSFSVPRRRPLLLLSLAGCKLLTDATIHAVAANCPLLNDIYLGELAKITDSPVEALLAKCLMLRRLDLFACVLLTDRTLDAASKAPSESLERLNVDLCGLLSGGGVSALRASRPELEVHLGRTDPIHNGTGAPVGLSSMTPDAAAEAPLLSKRVIISGLSARPELNGTVGVAEKFVPAKGRYGVRINDGSLDGSLIALKPANLTAAG